MRAGVVLGSGISAATGGGAHGRVVLRRTHRTHGAGQPLLCAALPFGGRAGVAFIARRQAVRASGFSLLRHCLELACKINRWRFPVNAGTVSRAILESTIIRMANLLDGPDWGFRRRSMALSLL